MHIFVRVLLHVNTLCLQMY